MAFSGLSFTVSVRVSLCVRVCVRERVCVLAVYNKAQAQRISNREFKFLIYLSSLNNKPNRSS